MGAYRNNRPGADTPGRDRTEHGNRFRTNSNRQGDEKQGPPGFIPARFKAGMIWVGGRHLCAVRDGELRRTFDASRELLRGALAFRVDVLRLAVAHGARVIVATERKSETVYRITLRNFRLKGELYDSAPAYGRQWLCDLKHWRRRDPEPEPGDPVQIPLFEAIR